MRIVEKTVIVDAINTVVYDDTTVTDCVAVVVVVTINCGSPGSVIVTAGSGGRVVV